MGSSSLQTLIFNFRKYSRNSGGWLSKLLILFGNQRSGKIFCQNFNLRKGYSSVIITFLEVRKIRNFDVFILSFQNSNKYSLLYFHFILDGQFLTPLAISSQILSNLVFGRFHKTYQEKAHFSWCSLVSHVLLYFGSKRCHYFLTHSPFGVWPVLQWCLLYDSWLKLVSSASSNFAALCWWYVKPVIYSNLSWSFIKSIALISYYIAAQTWSKTHVRHYKYMIIKCM